MNYADIKEYDAANGYGVRLSLFVSGCPHHCKGCFNSETWDFNFGKPFREDAMKKMISILTDKRDIYDGITILGGEPMAPENYNCVVDIIDTLIEHGCLKDKTVWIYTGYRFEELIWLYGKESGRHINFRHLLDVTDVIVDGRFVERLKDLKLRFRGSSNQRIIDVKKTIKPYRNLDLDDFYDKLYDAVKDSDENVILWEQLDSTFIK